MMAKDGNMGLQCALALYVLFTGDVRMCIKFSIMLNILPANITTQCMHSDMILIGHFVSHC